MKFTLKEIEQAVGAKFETEKDGTFEISTDTRTIKKGDLYLPLKGASFDGEDFCDKALEAGAAGCFYTKSDVRGVIDVWQKNDIISVDNSHTSSLPYIHTSDLWLKVPDTLSAYLQIANFARKKYNPLVVGVTGSSGKTTTKEMIYAVLSEKFKTHKTFSNHNNEIGFCQTVLSMPEDCEVLIVEMGMRGLGEIELITKYAEPDYAVITNAGSAHIGRLGSLDNIAKAKCEITKYLKKALVAHDNERIRKFANFDGEKIFYSINEVEIIEKKTGYSKFSYKGKIYELNVEGDYNIENSLAAIELGYKTGMTYEEIKSGLTKYKPIEKRWEVQTVNGFNIINDSYNANPESMKASVSTFLELYKNPVAVLGNMGELGENEIEFHREVGRYIAERFIKAAKQLRSQEAKQDMKGKLLNDNSHTSILPYLHTSDATFLTVGDLAYYIGEELEKQGFSVKHFNNNIETSRYILDNLHAGCTIFLKASRAMKFEEIIENIRINKK